MICELASFVQNELSGRYERRNAFSSEKSWKGKKRNSKSNSPNRIRPRVVVSR